MRSHCNGVFKVAGGQEIALYIERLHVESEGFLAGLDLEFEPGLNVIIGARGTGKTSIIELIRFCAAAGAFTEDALTRGQQQAVATLAGGAVTLTVRDESQRFMITRSASGHFTYSQPPSNFSCTVLAQNEIEAVGAQAAGRLHLIDRFRKGRDEDTRELSSIRTRLNSFTVEIAAIIDEGRAIADEVEALRSADEELAQARDQQQQLLEVSQATDEQQQQLRALQDTSRLIAAREATLNQDVAEVTDFARDLTRLTGRAGRILQPWPESAGKDILEKHRTHIYGLQSALQAATDSLALLDAGLSESIAQTVALRASVDTHSRHVRQQLESVQVGIGQASRRVAELEEKHGRLQALKNSLAERRKRFDQLAEQRNALYAQLDKKRTAIFEARAEIADILNRELSPTVRVRVTRSENVDSYRSAIVAGLRGSGVHYNTLAPLIAKEISPLELVRWVELQDVNALGSALGLRADRAQIILAALSGAQLAEIIGSEIEDGVALDLLDGPEYKSSDRLSIGQRCTVVLPVLLGQHGDPLVLDQPEDHLDNAFIAMTLVAALRHRRDGDQFIFSSHNANIPVLGNADQVTVMESDGEHGYVAHSGPLDDPSTVRHITKLMEGGKKAFAARSEFYQKEGGTSRARR
jgi:ABC-type lipoprotein export system ATPase subunit